MPGQSREGEATLLILTDASLALVIHAFLVYPTDKNKDMVCLLSHQSHLASTVKTIPKRELMALCYGAQIAQTIISELSALSKNFIVCSDSRVSLFWVLNQHNTRLELFIANRVQTIRSSLNLAVEQLISEHQALEIRSEISNKKATTQSYQDILYWVPGSMNMADQGTKFKTYDETGLNNKTLRADDCGPSSAHYLGLPWMTQIQKTINEGVIILARDLSSK